MNSRHIASFTCCFPDPLNASEAVSALVPDIPKRAARRMSLLGKQIYHVLTGIDLDLQTSIIYGTTYTEARALETFLDSIPFASPTAFQTSIHPGGIEQALILQKQEVAAMFPLAGNQTLFTQMVRTAMTCTTPRTVLVGGEENGTWLQDFDLAYPRLFAFSLELTQQPENSIGNLTWEESDTAVEPTHPSMEEAVRTMQARQILTFGSPDHGRFQIAWK